MSLKIEKKNGVYFLEGKINSTTLPFIKEIVKEDLKQHKTIEINIEKISVIDVNGVSFLYNLIENGIRKDNFILSGYGCKEIYQHYLSNQIA